MVCYQTITLEKLGARLGMTRELRQIQIRTLNNLRKDFTACGLEHIDLLDYELLADLILRDLS